MSTEPAQELPQRQRPTGERILRASAPPPPVSDAGSPFDSPEELEVQQILASRPALGQNTAQHASQALPRVRTPDGQVESAGGADEDDYCPNCGSLDISRHQAFLPSPVYCETDWVQCENCGHQWNHR